MNSLLILPSGNRLIDTLLEGGLHTGELTHIYGEAAAGKTTLALQFVQSAYRIGIFSLYINSESTSPIPRLEQIANREFEKLKERITLVSPMSFQQQGKMVANLESYVREGTKLVVVDTMTKLYRSVLSNKKQNYAAHRQLNTQTGILKGIIKQRDIALLILNQARGSFNTDTDFEPVAKNIMEYWADRTLRMGIGNKTGERIIEYQKNDNKPIKRSLYLTDQGLEVQSKGIDRQ